MSTTIYPESRSHSQAPAPASDQAKARRPVVPVLLVLLGAAMYFGAWVVFMLPPNTLPMMPVFMASFFGPLICSVALAAWWLALGRWSFQARFVALVVVASFAANTALAAHEGTRGWMLYWGLPAALAVMTLALWLLFNAPAWARVGTAALLALAAILPWDLARIEGVTGAFGLDWHWRWEPTKEQRLAEYLENQGSTGNKTAAVAELGEGDWPGFRGPDRDGRAPGIAVEKLTKLWEHPVGAGWGSVSGVGDHLFTQEQIVRDKEEVVACYDLKTGDRVWVHAEKVAFEEDVSGPGPRATPTFAAGKLYALGGTGVLVRLDATTGKLDWKATIKESLGLEKPHFGQACSPLVMGGKVYVHPGVKGPVLAAFDAETGKFAWKSDATQETESYSSPQRATLAGVEQVLVFGSMGLTGHDPESGKELWRYDWVSTATSQPCVQPTLLPGDRVVIGGAQPGTGMQCVKVKKDGEKWSAELDWETARVTPRFNDVVLHEGHLYGLDGGQPFCLDAKDGELKWKARRGNYGSGQMMLVGDKLVIVAEEGPVWWMKADPEGLPEAQKIGAVKGKTWNHPAVVRGRLIVRNAGEMACFGTKE